MNSTVGALIALTMSLDWWFDADDERKEGWKHFSPECLASLRGEIPDCIVFALEMFANLLTFELAAVKASEDVCFQTA